MSLKLFRSTGFARSSLFVADQRRAWSPAWIVVGVSVWLASLGNLPLWRAVWQLPGQTAMQAGLLTLVLALVIAGASAALLSLLGWRWTLRPAATLLLLIAAAAAHFMWAYGVVIDPTMIVNVLHTDARETRDLLDWRLLAWMLAVAVLPALWLWRLPLRRERWTRALVRNGLLTAGAAVVVVAAVALGYRDLSTVMRSQPSMRYLINPLASLWSLGRVATAPIRRGDDRLHPVAEDATLATPAGAATPVLLLVVGETARSANFSLNGYGRPTNPQLAAAGVVSWRQAWSCGTNTAVSLPCMFSHLGRQGREDDERHYESLMDVLHRSGLAVLWLDNQSGCKGICDRVPNATTARLSVPGLCDGGECHDEVMLHQLDERIAALDAGRRARGVVVVLHQMGSHGPAYHKRVPPAHKRFMPECTGAALQSCPVESLVNAYDNTIVYTDHVLARAIDWLRARGAQADTALMYVSDHGESLGEKGLYLHGLPWRLAPDVQKHVPWIVWLSPEWQARRGPGMDCLRAQTEEPISHDHYFHSVLGLLDVRTNAYKAELDIFRRCRSGR